MKKEELKIFLDEKVIRYNQKEFIDNDPIQIPHMFKNKQDIEISALLSATIAWGNRKSIIKNAKSMMERMDMSPYEFVVNANTKELKQLDGFVHRTFNDLDFKFFVKALQNLYKKHKSLENLFLIKEEDIDTFHAIENFRNHFFMGEVNRTSKHVSSPAKNSAAKRLNMFLRWMVRRDAQGVDFGLWQKIPMSKLSCPLDVHSGNIARKLGLLNRLQNDYKAVKELDKSLRTLDTQDPVKYDFALFGLGVNDDF